MALLVAGSGAANEEGDAYLVRAIFDNGAFVVADEEVRIAGARVGVIDSVDVTLGDERVHEDGSPDPGKAVVVMRIDDPGFQDWRQDASCLIRPQSLLGEKFIECEPTQERAAGTEAPPELDVVPEGEPGEGQRFLPVERTMKSVDLDLVNNIMREPYPDRFRLILNELGAGLATRGDELEEIVERGNPALKQTNELLAMLKGQTRQLNDLARDADRSLGPLAQERESISGFLRNATTAGQATAERTAELEAGFERMPEFFRELELTMGELKAFSDQAAPVFSDFGDAAPAITRSTRALAPFSRAGVPAFRSLGDGADAARDDLVASVPVIRDLGRLASETKTGTRILGDLLTDLRERDGYQNLMRLFFYGTGAVNGFDSFGHFMRGVVPVNNCFTYKTNPEPGCDINFNRTFTAAQRSEARRAQERVQELTLRDIARLTAPAVQEDDRRGAAPSEPEPAEPSTPLEPADGAPDAGEDSGAGESEETSQAASRKTQGDMRALMDFLLRDGGVG